MNDLSPASISGATEVEVEVIEAKETWSQYRLADGTLLRVKPIMIAVSRVGDVESANGEPTYSLRSTLITDVREANTLPHLG